MREKRLRQRGRICIGLLGLSLLSMSCAGWRNPHPAAPDSVCRGLNAEEWRGVANLAVIGRVWEESGDQDHMAKAVRVFGAMLKRCEPGRFAQTKDDEQ